MLNIVFDAMTVGSLRMTVDPAAGKHIAKKDILCLEFHLDIGYLESGIDSKYRIELPDRLMLEGCFIKPPETGFTDTGKTNLKNWATLKGRLQHKEPVRVWYSEAPHALCGFYHLCTLLQNYSNDVFVMKAPAAERAEDGWRFSSGWGSVPQDTLGEYFTLSQKLEKQEIQLYAARWEKLAQENAPLRAVIDGVVHSVGENYYNHFIEQQIPDKPIKESLLIMNTLAAYPLGIYDFWLELRIQKMIDDGKLIVTEAPDGLKLHRVLQKAGKG